MMSATMVIVVVPYTVGMWEPFQMAFWWLNFIGGDPNYKSWDDPLSRFFKVAAWQTGFPRHKMSCGSTSSMCCARQIQVGMFFPTGKVGEKVHQPIWYVLLFVGLKATTYSHVSLFMFFFSVLFWSLEVSFDTKPLLGSYHFLFSPFCFWFDVLSYYLDKVPSL